MSKKDFYKAWNDAIQDFICGYITYEQLLEYGTIDEFYNYMEDFKIEDEQPITF